MKATGIVRRLDDLGRLVIPKEIRKIYKLKEGDSIEFYVDEDNRIILKKYSALQDDIEHIDIMCRTLQEIISNPVMFVQDEKVLCVGSEKMKPYKDYTLSSELNSFIKVYHVQTFDTVSIFKNQNMENKGVILPVAAYGDWLGAFVILLESNDISSSHLDIAQAYCKLLTRQQEH